MESKARNGVYGVIRTRMELSTWKSKDAGYLSDEELNRRNSRLQRENQYRQLTEPKRAKALKWIKTTASTVLVASAIGASKGRMSKAYTGFMAKYGSKLLSWVKRKGASVAAAVMMGRGA